MMKIGQVTLFNYNYGSVLQCYATQRVVQSLGADCILFQRKENKMGDLYAKFSYLLQAFGKMAAHPIYAKTYYQLMKASRKNALSALTEEDLSEIQRFANEELDSVELSLRNMRYKAKTLEYTLFLSGSDQIWNGDWFLRNEMYFLRFAPREKRVAWAPSFGTVTVAPYNRRRFQRDIGAYRMLSARETTGIQIIRELTGKEAQFILDPVLQLSAQEWRDFYRERTIVIPKKPYVFTYFLNEPSPIALKTLKKLSDDGYLICAFSSKYDSLQSINGIEIYGGSPWNYLALLDGAEYVFSDSFHALAFSLLFHKQMLIFKRQYAHHSDQSGRIQSLLDIVGMPERFITDMLSDDLIVKKVDFEISDKILVAGRVKAMAYLKQAVEESTL